MTHGWTEGNDMTDLDLMGAGAGRRRPAPLHLLWAVPVGAVFAVVLISVASIAMCGVDSCEASGSGDTPTAAGYLVLAGLAAGFPFVAVPWISGRWRRVAVALGVAVLTTVVGGFVVSAW